MITQSRWRNSAHTDVSRREAAGLLSVSALGVIFALHFLSLRFCWGYWCTASSQKRTFQRWLHCRCSSSSHGETNSIGYKTSQLQPPLAVRHRPSTAVAQPPRLEHPADPEVQPATDEDARQEHDSVETASVGAALPRLGTGGPATVFDDRECAESVRFRGVFLRHPRARTTVLLPTCFSRHAALRCAHKRVAPRDRFGQRRIVYAATRSRPVHIGEDAPRKVPVLSWEVGVTPAGGGVVAILDGTRR